MPCGFGRQKRRGCLWLSSRYRTGHTEGLAETRGAQVTDEQSPVGPQRAGRPAGVVHAGKGPRAACCVGTKPQQQGHGPGPGSSPCTH